MTVISAVVKLAKKQEVNWKRTAVSLVGLVVVYALTFIPAVERFLSSDRLRYAYSARAGFSSAQC
mgnify:CR=1 FL=1